MKKCTVIAAILVMTCFSATAGWARTAYVTDSFRFSLRTGPSLENKILKFLSSGDPVEILDTREGWNLVKAQGSDDEGIEGWILSRYLIERIPWEQQTETLTRENAEIRERLSGLEKDLARTEGQAKEVRNKLQETLESLSKVSEKYEELRKGAPDFLKVKVAYDSGQKAIQRLTRENEKLKSSQINRWFALGAVVLLCGLMIGLIVGRQQKKRRSSLYS